MNANNSPEGNSNGNGFARSADGLFDHPFKSAPIEGREAMLGTPFIEIIGKELIEPSRTKIHQAGLFLTALHREFATQIGDPDTPLSLPRTFDSNLVQLRSDILLARGTLLLAEQKVNAISFLQGALLGTEKSAFTLEPRHQDLLDGMATLLSKHPPPTEATYKFVRTISDRISNPVLTVHPETAHHFELVASGVASKAENLPLVATHRKRSLTFSRQAIDSPMKPTSPKIMPEAHLQQIIALGHTYLELEQIDDLHTLMTTTRADIATLSDEYRSSKAFSGHISKLLKLCKDSGNIPVSLEFLKLADEHPQISVQHKIASHQFHCLCLVKSGSLIQSTSALRRLEPMHELLTDPYEKGCFHAAISELFLEHGLYEETVDSAKQAISYLKNFSTDKSRNAPALLYLARTNQMHGLFGLERLEEVISVGEDLLKQHGYEDLTIIRLLSDCYFVLENYEKAGKHNNRALRLLSETPRGANRFQKAEALTRKAEVSILLSKKTDTELPKIVKPTLRKAAQLVATLPPDDVLKIYMLQEIGSLWFEIGSDEYDASKAKSMKIALSLLTKAFESSKELRPGNLIVMDILTTIINISEEQPRLIDESELALYLEKLSILSDIEDLKGEEL